MKLEFGREPFFFVSFNASLLGFIYGKRSARFSEYYEDELKNLPWTLIGQGGFSSVYKANVDGKEVAIKVFELKSNNQVKEIQWKAERDFLKITQHPNIVRLVGFVEGKSARYIVLEYLPHSLRETIRGLTLPQIISILLDVARGLQRMHDATPPMIHADVKSDNVLVTSDLKAKLSDFGTVVYEGQLPPAYTDLYADQELRDGLDVTAKADIFSFGILLLQMLSKSEINRHHKILGSTEADVGGLLNELAKMCIEKERESRPDIKNVMQQLEVIRERLR